MGGKWDNCNSIINKYIKKKRIILKPLSADGKEHEEMLWRRQGEIRLMLIIGHGYAKGRPHKHGELSQALLPTSMYFYSFEIDFILEDVFFNTA